LGAAIFHPWNRALCAREGMYCAEDWPALGRALEPVLGTTASAGAPDR
jgi:hypothetical protein